MIEFLKHLFTSDFMPHAHCYYWKNEIIWLHAVSDSAIALAYVLIPIALLIIVKRREDLAFNWMFVLFGAFIFLCGSTHAFEVWSLWHGTYRLTGIVKLLTGAVSLATAALLFPLIPKIMAIPSAARLREEIDERSRIERDLHRAHENLEHHVLQRTTELEQANAILRERSEKLQRFQNVTVGRELEMIRLKGEVNELLQELGRDVRYEVRDKP